MLETLIVWLIAVTLSLFSQTPQTSTPEPIEPPQTEIIHEPTESVEVCIAVYPRPIECGPPYDDEFNQPNLDDNPGRHDAEMKPPTTTPTVTIEPWEMTEQDKAEND